MYGTTPNGPWHNIWHKGRKGLLALSALAVFSLYVFVAAVITTVFPPFAAIAVAPALPLILWLAPESRPVPREIPRLLIIIGAVLMPLWPIYLHIKLGPLPIITPTRIAFYALTFIWVYEMACVRWRRLQFLAAARRLWPLFALVALFFLQKFIAVPFALGKSIAAKEFFRETVIWFLPFLAVITYVYRRRMMDRLITCLIAATVIVALIALAEFATRTHIAGVLAPLIGDASWLQLAVEEKIRDGTFRAQSVHTHPLALGEHLAMILPFVMYKAYRDGPIGKRVLYIAAFILMLGALAVASSRGAIIGGGLALGATFILLLIIWVKRPQNLFLRPLAGFIMAAIVVATPVVGAAAWRLTTGAEGTAAARSSQSRITQIEQAIPKIMARPLNGYGNGRAARVLGFYGSTLSIDNYYLTVALDLGLPGLFLIISIFGLLTWTSWRWGMRLDEDPYAPLYMAMAGMAISFAVTRIILSMTANIEMFFLLMAVMIGSCGQTKRLLKKWRPAKLAEPEEDASKPLTAADLEAHRQRVLAGHSLWTHARG